MHARLVCGAPHLLQENLPLDSPSGRQGPRAPSLHSHSLRLAKADSGLTMSSYQTKLRQQYQQSASDLLCRSLQGGSVCCACCAKPYTCHRPSAGCGSALQLRDLQHCLTLHAVLFNGSPCHQPFMLHTVLTWQTALQP